MAVSPGLLTIGEFAKRCRLTVVTLRHYDREALLAPAEVDARTGYRYYHPDQVAIALQLALLRRVDVPVAELRAFVAGAAAFDDVLSRQRTRLARERDERDEMIAVVDALIARGEPPEYEIVRALEPSCTVAALAIDSSWERLEPATRYGLARLAVILTHHGCTERAPRSTGALFPVEPRDRLTVTVFALVDDRCVLPPSLSLITLAGVDALSTVHEGDHQLLGYAYRALLAQVAVLDLTATGEAREHYSIEPDGRVRTRLVVPVG